MWFLFQTFIMILGYYTNLFGTDLSPWSTGGTLMVVIAIAMFFEGKADLFRHEKDTELNTREATIFRFENGSLEKMNVHWRDIRVGDYVVVKNRQPIPADLALLTSSENGGVCYIETSNIDGETNLKLRLSDTDLSDPIRATFSGEDDIDAIRQYLNDKAVVSNIEQPNRFINAFTGNLRLDDQKMVALSEKQLLLRGSMLRNTGFIVGLAVYTGEQTKVMMNAREATSKMSKIEIVINGTLTAVVTAQCVLVTIVDIARLVWNAQKLGDDPQAYWYIFPPNSEPESYILPEWLAYWFTFFILFNNFVPISLVAVMEFCHVWQGYFINTDLKMYDPISDTPARTRATNLCQELGQVEYIFSDKTGTLTQNVMKFVRCSIGGKMFGTVGEDEAFNGGDGIQGVISNGSADESFQARFFLICMAVAHTVVPEIDEDGDLVYQAESPDEAALVQGAAECGYRFIRRDGNKVVLEVGQGEEEWQVLAINTFNSTRKRMSVLVTSPDGKNYLLCKGADNVIFDRAEHKDPQLDAHLSEFASEGLRTLLLSYRELDESTMAAWKATYDAASVNVSNRKAALAAAAEEIEVKLTVVGASAIEDKLQVGVPDTIADLAEAGIKLWVLTGDKMETAINIGYSSKVLRPTGMTVLQMDLNDDKQVASTLEEHNNRYNSEEDFGGNSLALVITGSTLNSIMDDQKLTTSLLTLGKKCSVVIACRVSPLQKAQLVRMVKEGITPQPITLGIGDGANDVGMIMEAHVGIGISGKEGMQAVNSSDFAIAQFRFLKRLLLVHGRWNYRRMCKVVVYTFYKNFCITLVLFYYTFSTGYSGTSLFEQWLYSGFNWFTAAPIIAVGVLDQDVTSATAEAFPALYMSGRLNLDLNLKVMLEAIFLAFLHSLIVFIWPALAFPGLEQSELDGFFVFGTTVFSCLFFAMQGRVMLITSTYTRWTLFSHLASYFLFFLFLTTYSFMTGMSLEFYQVPYHMLDKGIFWIVVFGVPLTSLSLDYILQYIKRETHSNLIDLAIEVDVKGDDEHRFKFKDLAKRLKKNVKNAEINQPMLSSDTSDLALDTITVDPSMRVKAIETPDPREDNGFAFAHIDDENHHRTQAILGQADKKESTESKSATQKTAPPPKKKKKALVEKNKPKENSFWQQEDLAWRPVVSERATTRTLGWIGLVFIITGVILGLASEAVVEHGVLYEGPTNDRARGSHWDTQDCVGDCVITIDIVERMEPPVYVFYELTNFYQNYLTYSTSVDLEQLAWGNDASNLYCASFFENDEGDTYVPCGLQANSLFNDTFVLEEDFFFTMDETGIAWKTDLKTKFNNPSNYPEICDTDAQCLYESYPGVVSREEGVENEHFIVWMRLAALSQFRKRYGVINSALEEGTQLRFNVSNNYPVSSFDGSKSLVLSTGSWLGGKNLFLGVAFVGLGTINIIAALTVFLKARICPREVGQEEKLRLRSETSLVPP